MLSKDEVVPVLPPREPPEEAPAAPETPVATLPLLGRGDAAPWFRARALSGAADYAFDTVAGRHVLMLFFGSARLAPAAEALALVERERGLFDDAKACFFGVTVDPEDAARGRIAQRLPGRRFFLDYDRRVSGLYGAADGNRYAPRWLLLDPALRVIANLPIDRGAEALDLLRARLAAAPADAWAPVLLVPDVLEPEMCAELIRRYEAHGGEESGFMRDVGGKTRLLVDPVQRTDVPPAGRVPEGHVRGGPRAWGGRA